MAGRLLRCVPTTLLAGAARPSTARRLPVAMTARWISDALKNKLDEACMNGRLVKSIDSFSPPRLPQSVKNNDVVLFMKGTPDQPMCGFSRAAVQILEVQGVDFKNLKHFNVLEDEELRQGIKEYSSWPTIPQIYIKGEFVGGTDILLNMHQSGELEDLLVKEGLVEVIEEAPEDKSKA